MKRLIYLPALFIMILAFSSCNSGKTDKDNSHKDEKTIDSKTVDKQLKADNIPESKYNFGDLPYSSGALKPVLKSRILELHYGKHHKGYYKKFLKAIKGTDADGKSLEEIFSSIGNYDNYVRNNAGGYYNHWVYWDNMTPDKNTELHKELKVKIEKDFGSLDNLKKEFENKASSQFGSGWAWLILTKDNELQVVNTPNQDNPLMSVTDQQGYPLLALDVWEHAYYPQYENKRSEYITQFWKIVNWDEVSKRYKMAKQEKYYMPK